MNTPSDTLVIDIVMTSLKKSGKIARATFVKKDGTIRNMRFIAAQSASYESKGCEIAKRTMEANPHLFRVVDLEAYTAAKKEGLDKQTALSKGFRQINAKTLTELAANGKRFKFSRDVSGSVTVTVA